MRAFAKLLLGGDLRSRRKLSAWPKDLQLEKVADPIPTLDIQAWMHKTKVPVVRVGSIDGTDNWNFDQLVGAVRNGGGVSRSSRWLPLTFRLTHLIVRHCEVGEPWRDPGPTSPCASWQYPAMCCTP